jgi:hypothetical protein
MRYLAWLCAAGLAFAQGTEPKAKASEYEVHATAKGVDVGAEYMVYSISANDRMLLVENHLVVEVALFPPKRGLVTASSGEFTLRVDGKMLRPVTAQMVVMAMQRSAWGYPRGPQDPSQQPFPTGRGRMPAPPRAPAPDDRSGLPAAEPVRLDEVIVKTALPEGEFRGAISGYLYFPFTAKASKIKSVELHYNDVRLKLK